MVSFRNNNQFNKSGSLSADPFAAINPNAFQQVTQRLSTHAPFPTRTKVNEETLRTLYTSNPQPKDNTLTELNKPTVCTLFDHLGKIGAAFFFVCIAGMFLFVTGKTSPRATDTESVTVHGANANKTGPTYAHTEYFNSNSPRSTPHEYATVKDYIMHSKVNGTFFHSSDSAIILNGETYRTGDIVLDDYSLTFLGFHSDRKHAVFKCDNGSYYKMKIH